MLRVIEALMVKSRLKNKEIKNMSEKLYEIKKLLYETFEKRKKIFC